MALDRSEDVYSNLTHKRIVFTSDSMSNCCGKLLVEVTGLTRSAWSILATLLLILLIFAIYSGNIEWRPAISDSIGYLQASHQLAKGEGLAFHDNHNLYKRSYFTLFAFNVSREGEANAYFSFPPGYPLLLASFERYVGSPSAAFFVGPFSVVGMVAATYGLGRRWFGENILVYYVLDDSSLFYADEILGRHFQTPILRRF